MAELTEADVVYSPLSLQVWRTLMNWARVFYSRVIIHFSLPLLKQPPMVFKPLPAIELLDRAAEHPTSVETASSTTSSIKDDRSRFQRLKVVFYLDETLVCAYKTSSLPAALRNQVIDVGLNWFELECLSLDKECDGKPKVNYVTVFERPGLHEFLEEHFVDLVLFTARLEGYARPLVDRIYTRKVLSNRLYRPSTVSTEVIVKLG